MAVDGRAGGRVQGGLHALRQRRGRSPHLSGTQCRHEKSWTKANRYVKWPFKRHLLVKM